MESAAAEVMVETACRTNREAEYLQVESIEMTRSFLDIQGFITRLWDLVLT
jgi:hypothetical protein